MEIIIIIMTITAIILVIAQGLIIEYISRLKLFKEWGIKRISNMTSHELRNYDPDATLKKLFWRPFCRDFEKLLVFRDVNEHNSK